jgi:hypothetical protein
LKKSCMASSSTLMWMLPLAGAPFSPTSILSHHVSVDVATRWSARAHRAHLQLGIQPFPSAAQLSHPPLSRPPPSERPAAPLLGMNHLSKWLCA